MTDKSLGVAKSQQVAHRMLDEGMTHACSSMLSEELRDVLTPLLAVADCMDEKTAGQVRKSVGRVIAMLEVLTSALPMGFGILAAEVREAPDDARALAAMMRRLAETRASPAWPNRPRILIAVAHLLEDRLKLEESRLLPGR